MRNALRFHYYAKHFKILIDEELEKSNSQCPMEKCSFSSQNLPKLVQHYIGKQHGILEKLIEKELPENKDNIEEKSGLGNTTMQFENDDPNKDFGSSCCLSSSVEHLCSGISRAPPLRHARAIVG